jgi:hypothetical protein
MRPHKSLPRRNMIFSTRRPGVNLTRALVIGAIVVYGLLMVFTKAVGLDPQMAH